jgi:NADPH-dependent 2,4-dienoyl-CoA reductase/sulfur reductase-like enzyme
MHVVTVGGSDAGISAALRARELDPGSDVTVAVADAYPNFSICGIPYYVSGEVTDWRHLAHRTVADLEATGMRVRTDTLATSIDVSGRRMAVTDAAGWIELIPYDALVIGTGALSVRPPIQGLSGPDALGPGDGVHLLRSIGDTLAVMKTIQERRPRRAVVIGAGYIGLEMAEGLTTRGLTVTQIEALPEVLPTVDPDLGAIVHGELTAHGVEVITNTAVTRITRHGDGLHVEATGPDGRPLSRTADLVLVVVGVRPDTALAAAAGARLGVRGAIEVDEQMRTTLPGIWAAGDCVTTHHRLLGTTWLPLGTTAHKQGRVAGENALAGDRRFAGAAWARKPPRPDEAGLRPPPPARRTTTRGTTRAPPRSTCGSPATPTQACCWALNSSGAAPQRSRNGSTPSRPPCSTACTSMPSATSTCPTPHRSAPRGMPSRSRPKPGPTTTATRRAP